MKKKIALLISDDPHHWYLAALLRSKFNVVAVVIEPGAKQQQRLFHKKRYQDYLYRSYHHLRRELFRLNVYRRHYFEQAVPATGFLTDETITVDWINDSSVIELLRQTAPDATIIMGTSILSKRLLKAAGEMVLNIHGGYLPDYKGNFCFFFPVYYGDFDKIGSTIHFVDPGIDTGDILEVVVPSIYPEDFKSTFAIAEILYCRAEKLAIHRLVSWLEYYQEGGELPRQTQMERGHLYRTRDRKPYHDLILWLRKLRGQLVLPEHLSEMKGNMTDRE